MSQERLAEASGVSVRAIGDLERGATKRPQRQTVDALATGLGLDAATRDDLVRAARPVRRAATDQASTPTTCDGLIGRDRELAGLVKLLDQGSARLVTVVGSAGVGKSALALAAIDRLRPTIAAVTVLRLDALPDGADPLAMLAATAEGGGQVLVLIDGFDPGRTSAAAVAALLARHVGLRLLVTARAPVRVRAEHRWPIGPLGVPPDPAGPGGGGEGHGRMIGRYPAVRLLAERVRDVRPDFTIGDADAAHAGAIVRRLGGNPLAIELIAARLRTTDLSDMDAALAVELAGDVDQVLRRVVRATVDRLPRADAQRLALLAALGPVTPHELALALARRRSCGWSKASWCSASLRTGSRVPRSTR